LSSPAYLNPKIPFLQIVAIQLLRGADMEEYNCQKKAVKTMKSAKNEENTVFHPLKTPFFYQSNIIK